MMKNKYILLFCLLLFSIGAVAQKNERINIRKGNKAFDNKSYVKSETYYRKALDANKKSSISMYNLGNTLSMQKKYNDAMKMYQSAAKIEKDKSRLAQIYHNMGVLLMANKDYENAIKGFSTSLFNNPNDEETRYNLALAQKLLKKQKKDQNKNKNNKNKNKDKNKQNKDKNKQDKNKQNKDQNKQNQQQQKQNQNKMSKQNADQLLNAVMQQEKGTQEKMKKQGIQGNRLEKNW